jgi:putative membrane protein
MNTTAVKPDNTQLSLDRTWLAHERTLMAWVRTATSMIAFGFTVYKFFQFEGGRQSPIGHGILTPRDFALIIVSIGLVSLSLATFQHRKEIKQIAPFLVERRTSLAEVMAGIMALFGILVLVSAALRS